MDTDAISDIINHWASDQALLIDALAAHFEAEPECEDCDGTNIHCLFVHTHFDRAGFVVRCKEDQDG